MFDIATNHLKHLELECVEYPEKFPWNEWINPKKYPNLETIDIC